MHMKKFLLLPLCFFIQISMAQTIIQRDPQIEAMVAQVSSDSMKSYIQQLVRFGTRSTLSSTTDKNRGIGAARNWVVKKIQ